MCVHVSLLFSAPLSWPTSTLEMAPMSVAAGNSVLAKITMLSTCGMEEGIHCPTVGSCFTVSIVDGTNVFNVNASTAAFSPFYNFTFVPTLVGSAFANVTYKGVTRATPSVSVTAGDLLLFFVVVFCYVVSVAVF